LLERRFQRTLGRSPLQEIHRQRLQRAQALLAGSNLPIHRIAVAAGFASPPQFSDTFKRETGLTPRQYRKQTGSFAGDESMPSRKSCSGAKAILV